MILQANGLLFANSASQISALTDCTGHNDERRELWPER